MGATNTRVREPDNMYRYGYTKVDTSDVPETIYICSILICYVAAQHINTGDTDSATIQAQNIRYAGLLV